MNSRPIKRSICNAHGIRIYPVLVYGKYQLEVEFNKTSEFDRRYIKTNSKGEQLLKRGEEKYDPSKKEWAEKIDQLYEELYEKKVKPKLEKSITK